MKAPINMDGARKIGPVAAALGAASAASRALAAAACSDEITSSAEVTEMSVNGEFVLMDLTRNLVKWAEGSGTGRMSEFDAT